MDEGPKWAQFSVVVLFCVISVTDTQIHALLFQVCIPICFSYQYLRACMVSPRAHKHTHIHSHTHTHTHTHSHTHTYTHKHTHTQMHTHMQTHTMHSHAHRSSEIIAAGDIMQLAPPGTADADAGGWVCACVFTCMCACGCVFACMYTIVCLHVYIYTYMCVHVCAGVCMYVCARASMCLHVCIYACMCMRVRACVCMYTYTYVCVLMLTSNEGAQVKNLPHAAADTTLALAYTSAHLHTCRPYIADASDAMLHTISQIVREPRSRTDTPSGGDGGGWGGGASDAHQEAQRQEGQHHHHRGGEDLEGGSIPREGHPQQQHQQQQQQYRSQDSRPLDKATGEGDPSPRNHALQSNSSLPNRAFLGSKVRRGSLVLHPDQPLPPSTPRHAALGQSQHSNPTTDDVEQLINAMRDEE